MRIKGGPEMVLPFCLFSIQPFFWNRILPMPDEGPGLVLLEGEL
jgi:hypothetical protein